MGPSPRGLTSGAAWDTSPSAAQHLPIGARQPSAGEPRDQPKPAASAVPTAGGGVGQEPSFALSTAHQAALQPLRSSSAQPEDLILRPLERAVMRGQPAKNLGQRTLHQPFRPEWISCGHGMSLVRCDPAGEALHSSAQRNLHSANVTSAQFLADSRSERIRP